MEGSIKLFRSILESQVFAHQTALKIWIWCLCRANFKERFISLKIGRGETTIKLLPGQFVFGRFKAEEELGIDGSTIYKWIQKFASPDFDNMITIESNNQYSVITICKWDEYQLKEKEKVTTKGQPKDSQVTAEEQPCNTDNNVNNVYNVNNDFKSQFDIFRKKYPGTKRGLDVEFENLTKKHGDWKVVVPLLEKSVQYQITAREAKHRSGKFVPEWKNLQTWINQRCWEEEIQIESNSIIPEYSSGPNR